MTTDPDPYPPEMPANTQRSAGWLRRFVLRLWPEPPKWESVQKGPATIHTQRYEIQHVEIQGTYVKERNQYGEERYWITEPDGARYLKSSAAVSSQNS
jgi:hypothetical protein